MVNEAGTEIPVGEGTVQVIKGGPSDPPKPGRLLSGGTIATYDGATQIIGAVGDGGFGAGGFEFGKSTVDVISGNSFFVRYWTPGDGYYGQAAAQSISWDSFPTPPYVLNYTAFNLYLAGPPYEPVISKVTQKETLQKDLPLDNAPDTATDAVSQLVVTYSNGITGNDKDVQVSGKIDSM